MARFRVRRGDGTHAGGEFATYEDAHRWARQHCGAFWMVADEQGTSSEPILTCLLERLKRQPWHAGAHLDAFEVHALVEHLRSVLAHESLQHACTEPEWHLGLSYGAPSARCS